MTETPRDPPSIKRSFRDLSDAEVADIVKASALAKLGWAGSFGWDELLRSQRVLIVSEAQRLSKELGGTAKLMAKGLDLRPRLGTERDRATKLR